MLLAGGAAPAQPTCFPPITHPGCFPCSPSSLCVQMELSLHDLQTKFRRHSITATLQCTGNRWVAVAWLGRPCSLLPAAMQALLVVLLLLTRGFVRHSLCRRNDFNERARPVKGLEWDGGSISTAGEALPLHCCMPIDCVPSCWSGAVGASPLQAKPPPTRAAVLRTCFPVQAAYVQCTLQQAAVILCSLGCAAVWTGVRLRDVLKAAGLEDDDANVNHIQVSPADCAFMFAGGGLAVWPG